MAEKNDYPYLIPIQEWPIYKQVQSRESFVEEVMEFTYNRLKETNPDGIHKVLAKTIYLERIRTRENPWKVDPPHERAYWNRFQRQLAKIPADSQSEEAHVVHDDILKKILQRYANEIAGGFNIGTYRFARRLLTWSFSRLLNTASNRNFRRVFSSRYKLQERIKIRGDVELLRQLSQKGTMVVVPTHFSNLDSILVGWALDSIGLPAFTYGAGLNLYNSSIVSYFISRLGAYRLDRRKKNPVYLETLKSYSTRSILRGTQNLFFPGGTRSRSGSIEGKVKLGLLGTVTEAQRIHYQAGASEKIFIVPVVICYNFVLEARKLVDDFLKKEGKELYIEGKRELKFLEVTNFLWQLFSPVQKFSFHLAVLLIAWAILFPRKGKASMKPAERSS